MAISLGVNLMFLSGYNLMNAKGAIVDVVASGVLYAVIGLVIGLIVKDKKVEG